MHACSTPVAIHDGDKLYVAIDGQMCKYDTVHEARSHEHTCSSINEHKMFFTCTLSFCPMYDVNNGAHVECKDRRDIPSQHIDIPAGP